VHGRCPTYNFQVARNIFRYGTESVSMVPGMNAEPGRIVLRPLDDPMDHYKYPLFSKNVSLKMIEAIRCIWDIVKRLPESSDFEGDQNAV